MVFEPYFEPMTLFLLPNNFPCKGFSSALRHVRCDCVIELPFSLSIKYRWWKAVIKKVQCKPDFFLYCKYCGQKFFCSAFQGFQGE